MAKKLTSLRISEYTEAQISKMAERFECDQTELIALAIDRMFREEFGRGVNPLSPEQHQAAIERSRERRKVAAAELGSITSEAKAAAARANGKRGGRPRKKAE